MKKVTIQSRGNERGSELNKSKSSPLPPLKKKSREDDLVNYPSYRSVSRSFTRQKEVTPIEQKPEYFQGEFLPDRTQSKERNVSNSKGENQKSRLKRCYSLKSAYIPYGIYCFIAVAVIIRILYLKEHSANI